MNSSSRYFGSGQLPSTNIQQSSSVKVLQDGRLVILHGGKQYHVAGREIK